MNGRAVVGTAPFARCFCPGYVLWQVASRAFVFRRCFIADTACGCICLISGPLALLLCDIGMLSLGVVCCGHDWGWRWRWRWWCCRSCSSDRCKAKSKAGTRAPMQCSSMMPARTDGTKMQAWEAAGWSRQWCDVAPQRSFVLGIWLGQVTECLAEQQEKK